MTGDLVDVFHIHPVGQQTKPVQAGINPTPGSYIKQVRSKEKRVTGRCNL